MCRKVDFVQQVWSQFRQKCQAIICLKVQWMSATTRSHSSNSSSSRRRRQRRRQRVDRRRQTQQRQRRPLPEQWHHHQRRLVVTASAHGQSTWRRRLLHQLPMDSSDSKWSERALHSISPSRPTFYSGACLPAGRATRLLSTNIWLSQFTYLPTPTQLISTVDRAVWIGYKCRIDIFCTAQQV